ncbi:MAG: hypothetical protein NZ899_01035 [Thermoguttaceae bacterium]|nr:hypothetical protein [Thermoguttaceae bacterium]MDW8077478.1 DUF6655 family protein [Thermoguttaceae bacterium]
MPHLDPVINRLKQTGDLAVGNFSRRYSLSAHSDIKGILVLSVCLGSLALGMFFSIGCSTTRLTDTSRSGIEQLLLSTAIENSLEKIDFSCFGGRRVYVDDRFLECVDKKYLVAAIRRKLFSAGAVVVEKAEEADWVLEVSAAAVGTDRSEGFLGIPSVNIPGPIPVHTPEIRLISHTTQFGSAKISLVVYDGKLRESAGPGAVVHNRVTNTNWSVLGLGMINAGSLRKELIAARRDLPSRPEEKIALVNPRKLARLAGVPAGAAPAPEQSQQPQPGTASEEVPPVPSATPWEPPADLSGPGPQQPQNPSPPGDLSWPPDPNFPAFPLPQLNTLPLPEGRILPSLPLPRSESETP